MARRGVKLLRHGAHGARALSLVCALAACGGGAETTGTTAGGATGAGGAGGGGGGQGGAGGGIDCPAGSHDDGSGACAATLGAWSEGGALVKGRDHHVSFVATTPSGSFFYVAGGTSGAGLLDGVERSPLGGDGALAGFAAAGDLPRSVAGAGLAQIDRAVVLAGGLGMEGIQAVSIGDTVVGAIADDGALTFAAGPPLGATRYHLTLSADRGFVYAIGGLSQTVVGGATQQAFADAVERAPFDGTTLGAFTALAPLPEGLTHHAAVVREHAIYLIGGIAGTAARTDILRATVEESGDLGPWQAAGDLPEGRATSAAFVFLDQLYVIAGATQAMGGETATVLRASFEAGGAVGPFEELAALPLARAHAHQAPQLGTALFSAGGSIDHVVQGEVFVARFE